METVTFWKSSPIVAQPQSEPKVSIPLARKINGLKAYDHIGSRLS